MACRLSRCFLFCYPCFSTYSIYTNWTFFMQSRGVGGGDNPWTIKVIQLTTALDSLRRHRRRRGRIGWGWFADHHPTGVLAHAIDGLLAGVDVQNDSGPVPFGCGAGGTVTAVSRSTDGPWTVQLLITVRLFSDRCDGGLMSLLNGTNTVIQRQLNRSISP